MARTSLKNLSARHSSPAFAHTHRHPRWFSPGPSSRPFSSTYIRGGHYQTLDIPKDATRNQIKASFYKLSKQYHPDVNSEPGAKEKFQAVSEAYAILGDERKRRAYDRTLASPPHTHAHTPHESAHPHWSYEGRRRGASHAWEYARRPNSSGPRHAYPPPPGSYHYNPHGHGHGPQRPPPSGFGAGAGPNPFANPNVQRATGRRGPLPTDRGPTPADHVARESMFVRTATVAALVLLIATIGHGLSASALMQKDLAEVYRKLMDFWDLAQLLRKKSTSMKKQYLALVRYLENYHKANNEEFMPDPDKVGDVAAVSVEEAKIGKEEDRSGLEWKEGEEGGFRLGLE
ncbi:hypothetical protein BD413DRAFT_675027 [Trametes elegans]|nr:hypothetical protein BD413DRAFT_675027 [Trametes elegans]